MARVSVSYCFADGDQIHVAMSGKTSYPDALHQMKHEAMEAFRETAATMLRNLPAEVEGE